MIRLDVGRILSFTGEGHCERLVWWLGSPNGFYCIDIHAPYASPVFRNREEIEDLVAAGLVDEASDPWEHPLAESALTSAQRDKRDENWALIQPLIVAQPRSFNSEHRAAIVEEILATTSTSRKTLYRQIRRYWQRGMTPNALLPDYANSGAPGRPRRAGSEKRGRPTVFGLPGMNIDATARRQIKDAVTRFFGRERRYNVAEAHQLLLETCYMETSVDPATGRQRKTLRLPYPSIGQFRYWLEKDNDSFAMDRKRRTPRVYDKDIRGILGTSTAEVIGPGSRWQIDATIADIYLVSRMDRSRIVGRPTLYFAIDVFSRMIVGLHVGLEAPSWVGAMSALVNAASDKVAFCKAHGIEIEAEDWPCQGLPDVLLGDRGEMLGERAEVLVKHFGVRLENTPPYRADLKGIVEKRFHLIQADFGPYVPGYEEPDFRQRGARDYRLDATLTIDEFTAVIISCVLAHNLRHLRDYPRDMQMIADDVPSTPIDLWEWGIARRSGQPRRYSEEKVRLSLLPEAEATVTETGIRFHGCFYSCAEAVAGHWFDRARQRGSWKVRISYDTRSLDTIWLHGESPRPAFTPCTLTQKSEMWRDRTLWEIDQIRQAERRATAWSAPANHEAKARRNDRVRQIADAASEATSAARDPSATKAGRLRDIRASRSAEREALQKERAVVARHRPASDGQQVIPFAKPAEPDDDEPSIADVKAYLRAQLEDGDDDG